MDIFKDKKTIYIPVFNIVIVLLCLCLTVGIAVGVSYLKPADVSRVYAANSVWNARSSLKTGENIKQGSGDREGFLTVPIPEGIGLGDIKTQSDYVDHVVRIVVPGIEEEFFKDHFISGDMKNIDILRYGFEDGGLILELLSSKFYETELEITDGKLYVGLIPPHEKYDRIVIVDAAYGGSETGSTSYGVMEKDITLNAAIALKEAAKEAQGYHIYFTRSEDRDISEETRKSLIEDTGAEFVLRLRTDADPDTRVTHGISAFYYNDEHKEIAEKLVKAVAESTVSNVQEPVKRSGGGLTGGLTEGTDIAEIDLGLGFITNKRDALTVSSEKFAQRSAESIIAVLNELFLK